MVVLWYADALTCYMTHSQPLDSFNCDRDSVCPSHPGMVTPTFGRGTGFRSDTKVRTCCLCLMNMYMMLYLFILNIHDDMCCIWCDACFYVEACVRCWIIIMLIIYRRLLGGTREEPAGRRDAPDMCWFALSYTNTKKRCWHRRT